MFRIISCAAIALQIVVLVVHYVKCGPRHPELKGEAKTIQRFSLWERIIRAVIGLSFIALAITGFVPRLVFGVPLTHFTLMLHVSAAGLFAVGIAAMALTWAKECRFKKFDWDWFVKLGGYCGEKQDLPSERFDAGEKATFWFVVVDTIALILSSILNMYPIFSQHGMHVMLQIHQYSALLLVLIMVKYVYYQLIAKPGAWSAFTSGRVGPGWARRNHPLWWQQIEKTAGRNER